MTFIMSQQSNNSFFCCRCPIYTDLEAKKQLFFQKKYNLLVKLQQSNGFVVLLQPQLACFCKRRNKLDYSVNFELLDWIRYGKRAEQRNPSRRWLRLQDTQNSDDGISLPIRRPTENPSRPTKNPSIRTGVAELAGGPGFEPGLTESESVVLPLDDPPKGI